MKKQQKLFLLGLFICIFALAIPSFFAKADIKNSNIATNSDAIVENSEGEVTTAEVLNEQTSEESSNIETLETSEETENLSFVTQSIDTNSVDDIEFLEEDEVLLGTPAPANVVEINSQEDWNEFITLQPSAENPDCPWGNSGGSCIYIGADSEVTIQINADISVTSGSPWFVDGNTTVPTKFNITGNGSVNGTFLFPAQYEYSISEITFINSTVEVKGTTSITNASFENSSAKLEFDSDFNLTGTSFNNSTVEFVGTTTDLSCSLNGCSFTNGSVLRSTANPIDLIFTNTNVSDSSMFENNGAVLSSLSINGGTFSNDTAAFQLIGDSSISNATFTNTDINYLNNVATNIYTVTGCIFNNSHFTSSRSSATLNIEDSNFDGNTKSILNVGTSQGEVELTLDNVTGTNCHYDFIHNEYAGINTKSIDGLNISTNDSGLHGLYGVYGSKLYPDTFSNSTIDGFDYGVYFGEYTTDRINWDNLTITNFSNTGIFIKNTGSTSSLISNCTITGADSAEYGIYLSAGNNSGNYGTLFNEQYDAMRCIDNCDISKCNFGIYTTQADALVKDSNIHNVNSGIRVNSGNCAAIRCTLTAKENPNEDSYGVANLNSTGCDLVDCDITGFYVGAANKRPDGTGVGGAVEAYGCNFINNIKNGICGYCSTAVNCLFTGSTEIMFNGRSATNGIFDCTFEGDGTNVGIEDYEVYFYINYSGGTNARAQSYSTWSNRDLSIGKTEFSNLKIALNAPNRGGIEGGNGVYIHDCETGVSLTCGGAWNEHGNYHIKDCKNGVIYRNAYIYPGENSSVLIENCDIGIQDDYDAENDISHSTWLTGGGGNGFEIKNCDIGMYLHKNFSSNSSIPMYFEGNRIGCILEEPRGQISFGTNLTLKDNSETGIKCKDLNGAITSVRIDGNKMAMINENQAMNVEGVIIINESSWEADGTDEYYLVSPESYLKIYTPYMFTDYKMIFDMPDSGYQEDRLVAITTTQGYTDSFLTNKEGWIIVYKQSVDNSGEPIDNSYDHYLTAGCLVTYDYATNGGTSMSGNVTGSEMYASTDVNYFSKWKFKKDNPIDLSPVAVKDGYEFVGWNTDPDATEGLTSLTAGTKDITLYAIYRTTKTVTYHTFDANDNYTQDVYLYNNQTETVSQLAAYPVTPSDLYEFVGYVFSENVSDVTNSIMHENDNFTVSDNRLNVYCVYDTHSVLTYKDVAGNTIATDNSSMRAAATNIINAVFRYVLINKIPVEGYTFDGWIDSQGGIHPAGEQYIITDHEATLTAKESEIKVNKVQLAPKTAEIYVGDRLQFTVTLTPDNALNKDVAWSINNNKAEITNDGLLTGLEKGTVTVTATNINSGKADTATVVIKDAKSDNPSISISDDYKVTITAGDVQDDELDKIYYRINGGEWKEYTGKFPVFKKFKVEAYQITKIKRVQSDIVELSGTEYATGITAEYIGDPKPIGTDVTKPEVIVTVHYPNSPDEVVTDFSLEDYTIDEEGPNDVTVVYNEYPDDADSPELTTTVTVIGIPIDEKPDVRIVTIKGRLLYADGSPIANKTIVLNWHEDESKEEKATETSAVKGAASLTTQTDADGNYVFESIQVGEYQMEIKDGNTTLATCIINVKAPKEDSVDVKRSLDNVEVDYSFSDSIITIDATITVPKEETPAEPTPANIEPPTEEPPTEEPVPTSVKTGDNAKPLFVGIVCIITIISMVVLIRIKKKL